MRIEPDQMWGYWEWLFLNFGLLKGLLFTVVLSALAFLVCFFIAMARFGPGEGFLMVSGVIAQFFSQDLVKTSPRRIYAMARLAAQEAIRRKVLAVVAVFIVVMLFAGWYLDPGADHPARLYISFVLSATAYMVILLGLFLSTFSIPNDIKNRTIYTIVTKPVRPTEIVIGRIAGFTAVGTGILLVMGTLSYVFVERGVRHAHDIETVAADGVNGTTSFDAKHEHTFTIGADGKGVTDEQKDHVHVVTKVEGADGKPRFVLGEPEGMLQARIPVFGTLRFTSRDGTDGDGINVGYESEYQKYIEGASLASAIWTFENVTEDRFSDNLLVEMTLKAFRTFKGDIVTGVRGNIIVRNPNGTAESDRIPFIIKEFQVDQKLISRKLPGFKDGVAQELDLYNDLSDNGKLEIVVRCVDSGQYFGMASADLFLRAGDSTFLWNFIKGYIGVWLQMVIVICLGVMFSTFLSGPVAMIATLTCVVLGLFGNMAWDVLTGEQPGGGPVEAIIRTITQQGAVVSTLR